MILHNNQRNQNFIIKTILIAFIFSILSINPISAVELNDDSKITITSVDNTNGGLFQSNPILISIADVINEIDHVQLVVPVVSQIYGINMDDFPGNLSRDHPMGNDFEGGPPEAPSDGEFPNWNNRSFNDRNRNFNLGDYIIEGIILDSIESSGYSYLPDTISSGRALESNDSKMVYIGEDAQDYFNTTVGDTIEIDNVSFTVIGIFSDEELNKYVFMNINDAQNLLGIDKSEVNTFYVYVDDEDNLEDVCSVIEEQYPDLMLRYSGQMGSFNPPSNSPDMSDKGYLPGDNQTTPGFELTLFVGVIFLCFLYIKRIKGENIS
jgi:hypothetical protein